jgi:murein DD-endopeptidase MepM/ murein hydrolase activator NlpD
MAKFSEFMQHPRIARLLQRHAAQTDHGIDAATDIAADIATDSAEDAYPAKTQDDQAARQDTPNFNTAQRTPAPGDLPGAADAPPTTLHAQVQPLPTTARLRLAPLSARLGLLSLVAVVMWWTWPRSDGSAGTFAALFESHARVADAASLAVVNPVNVVPTTVTAARIALPEATAAATQAPFTQIVVVTPTAANPAEEATAAPLASPAIMLQASAVVTDATGATLSLEIPAGRPQTDVLVAALELEPAGAPVGGIQAEIVLLPTATSTPRPTPDAVALASSANLPRVQIVPAVGVRPSPTPEAPTPTAVATQIPSPTPPPIGPGRLWSTFVPLPPEQSDHFWVGNPFENYAANRFASPSYQFGSTAGNRYRPHHGIDISNPSGTPVQAAVAGEVVHAGLDDPDILGPYPNFYGKAVVIRLDQRLPVAGGELDVFVLYGHLSDVRVTVGQKVLPNDVIGLVGMTGIAIGPHLHLEMRLGANTYNHSVNPYLWAQPAPGNGAVAVRVLTADGRTWAGARVSIARFEGGKAVWARQIETYLDTENIGPDPVWGENGAMGDVPAGYYYLIATINGENLRAEFTVNAGQTSFVEIRTQK